MPARTVERLTWVLIFGGLLTLSLGLFVKDIDAALGWGIVVVGGLAMAVGVLLIWLRSRMRDDPS